MERDVAMAAREEGAAQGEVDLGGPILLQDFGEVLLPDFPEEKNCFVVELLL